MAKSENVVELVKSGDQDKIAAAVAELRRLLPARIEYQRVMARLQREAYDAYIAEGFDEWQALELCKDLKP